MDYFGTLTYVPGKSVQSKDRKNCSLRLSETGKPEQHACFASN